MSSPLVRGASSEDVVGLDDDRMDPLFPLSAPYAYAISLARDNECPDPECC